MTFFILSCISPLIRKLNSAKEYDVELATRFADIKTRLGTCHIVIVTTTRDLAGNGGEITARTKTGRDEGQNNTMGQSGLNFIDGSLNAPLEAYADVVKEARENGFRRINCSARMLFFEAMELSYLVGYMSPEENIDVKTDAARAEDLRNEEGRLRRRD